jgi:hypothetical protein
VIRIQTALSRISVAIFTAGYSLRRHLAQNTPRADGIATRAEVVNPVEGGYSPEVLIPALRPCRTEPWQGLPV